MLVKLGEEQSTLSRKRKCFDKFLLFLIILMLVKLGAEYSAFM